MQDSFLVLPCHSICPVSLLLLFYFALRFAPLAVHSTFSLSQLAVSVASLRCRYPVSLFPPFTRRLCSPDSLFPLLAFVFASQSHASCAFFLVLTSCLASFPSPRPAFHHLQYSSLNRTASDGKLGEALETRLQASCLHARGGCRGGYEGGDSRGLEQALACACLQTRGSHARACYLTCDLYCTLSAIFIVASYPGCSLKKKQKKQWPGNLAEFKLLSSAALEL